MILPRKLLPEDAPVCNSPLVSVRKPLPKVCGRTAILFNPASVQICEGVVNSSCFYAQVVRRLETTVSQSRLPGKVYLVRVEAMRITGPLDFDGHCAPP